MKVVSTIHDLVHALGGYSRVARWAGYEDSRGVYNWVARGIPPSHHLRLTIEAKRAGVKIHPDVLGIDDHDAHVLDEVFSSDEHAA